jgi:hypothetical protein
MIHITKIYLVTNCYNDPNKVYIGKTKNNRNSNHKKTFGKNIIYTEVDEINSLNKKDWEPLESYWIEQFRQWGFDVLNKNKGGGGPSSLSLYSKKQISINKKENILQYDMQGNFIKEWKGIVETDSIFSSTNKSSSIWACVNNLQRTAYGYIWFKKDEFNLNKLYQTLKWINNRDSKINQYDLKGNFIKEWDSPTIASKNLIINRNNIYNALNGHSKSSGGFVWKYKK